MIRGALTVGTVVALSAYLAWRAAWRGEILVLPMGGWGPHVGVVDHPAHAEDLGGTPWRVILEQPRAADGVPVPNSYPQVYEPSGSGARRTRLSAPSRGVKARARTLPSGVWQVSHFGS